MSLRGRLTLLNAIFLVVAIAASVGAAVFVTRAADAHRQATTLERAGGAAAELKRNLVTQAASIRAYFLDADPASLQTYSDARQASTDVAARLAGLATGGNLPKDVEDVTHDALTWRTSAINPLIALEQQGAYQQVIDQYSAGNTAGLFRRVNASMRVLQRDLAQAQRVADDRADGRRLQAIEFGLGLAVAVLAAFAFVRVAANMWVVQPISALADHMRRADPAADLPTVRGPTELQDLAASADGLRTRLHDEIEQSARARSAFGQHSAVLTALRARTYLPAQRLPAGWQLAADLVPASGIVAADCYDVSAVGATMTVLLIEAAEQGVVAAAAGLRAKELVRVGLRSHADVGAAIEWASGHMPEAVALGVTVFVAKIDTITGTFTYASAGHPEALLCDGVRSEKLSETGPGFGTRHGTWQTASLAMRPGEILIAYTDGLLAGRAEPEARFGLARLADIVHENYGDSCDVIVKQVLTEAGAFVRGRCHDDIAVAVVSRAMPM